MTLFEQFMLREKMAKSQAKAEAARREADAALERIRACENEMRRLLVEFSDHLAALKEGAVNAV
jgi:hypothetical protein